VDDLPRDPAGPRTRRFPLLIQISRGEEIAMPPTPTADPAGAARRPRLAILGAGPIGLEAALAAAEAGLPFTLYEAGDQVAANVRAWGHVRLFTPWEMNVSPRMRRHLAAAGEAAPPGGMAAPTGRELAELVLDRVAALLSVAPRLRLGTRVLAVGREGLLKHEEIATAERGRRPFRLLLAVADGAERVEHADVVLDATGTWGHPNSLGDGGIPAPGELQLGGEIGRAIPDLTREAAAWAGRTVLLAGAGASAQTAARDLAELARSAPETRVLWALRRAQPSWGSPSGDPLPERARLAAAAAELAAGASPAVTVERGVVVEAIARAGDGSAGRFVVTLRGSAPAHGGDGDPENGSGVRRRQVTVDRVLSLTGAVGDHQLYRQLQVHECYATCGPIKLSAALLGAAAGDCLQQTSHGVEALTNPEPGFFILGSKSYGRNNTFLLRVGWEQVDEVVSALHASD
jgi:cation diffusion facilitator CzcD-associated flavoprotein CzcO